MPPVTTFVVRIRVFRNFLPALAQRLKDFLPLWVQAVKDFRRHNVEKFDKAKGAELSGVYFDGTNVFWDPVTEGYYEAKREDGYDDQLMVREGETRDSLTAEGHPLWYEDLEPQYAVFGSTAEPVRWHWLKRQAVFLDAVDRRTIQRRAVDYLAGADPFARLATVDG